jgi:hypothetical protein
MDASVVYDYEIGASNNRIPNAQPPGPPWLRKLLGDDFFASVGWVSLREATDAALKRIEALARLRELDLTNTSITNAGLEHLKGLTQLKALRLERDHVTDAAVQRLQQALPNCRITVRASQMRRVFSTPAPSAAGQL